MKADDGKRCICVSLSGLPTSSRLNHIRVNLMGGLLPYRLGFYDPFSGLSMFWNPATGQLDSVEQDRQGDNGDAHDIVV